MDGWPWLAVAMIAIAVVYGTLLFSNDAAERSGWRRGTPRLQTIREHRRRTRRAADRSLAEAVVNFHQAAREQGLGQDVLNGLWLCLLARTELTVSQRGEVEQGVKRVNPRELFSVSAGGAPVAPVSSEKPQPQPQQPPAQSQTELRRTS